MNAADLTLEACEARSKGDAKKAFALFRKAAHLGYATAQHNLGYFYDEGIGTRKHLRKALYWYKKAWQNGKQTDSCINIGLLYASIGKNQRAIFWWKKAINKNDGDAALELAKFYIKRGKNERQVVPLLKKAAEKMDITEIGKEEAISLLKKLGKSTGHKN